ncbi:MAG: YraN family protein [Holosporales bacterium]|nr:YraN family protein [Holosporales bacterium]
MLQAATSLSEQNTKRVSPTGGRSYQNQNRSDAGARSSQKKNASSTGARSYQKGVTSEQRAASYLKRHGHVVVAQRYRNECGEIDIVSKKDSVLHIVEVKSRKSVFDARYSISPKQQTRISNAADAFVQSNDIEYDGIQMDAILLGGNDLVFIENAWYN